MHTRHALLPLLLLLPACAHGHPGTTPASGASAEAAAIRNAAQLITPAKVLQRIAVIADDSMGGRNTPSAGLEKTAQYLADNYRKWGLLPLGDSGTYFQRYRIDRVRVDTRTSYIESDEGGVVSRYPLTHWALVSGPMTGDVLAGAVTVLSGAITPADLAGLPLEGRVVLFVQNAARADTNLLVVRAIVAKKPVALLNLVNTDPAAFASRVADALQNGLPRPVVVGIPPTGVAQVTIHDSIFANDPQSSERPNWDALRAMPTPVIMPAPDEVAMRLKLAGSVVSEATAPNVVAYLPGTDPALRDQYVIFSAHMDHVGTDGDGVGGCTAKGTDRICNGADDDGSGTTGVLSIGEALAALKGHTHRSLIVLNVSGEEKGLLGSAYFAANPTVPLGNVIADLNMDMIGRNSPDSIVVIGKEHSDLGTTLARVQGEHPELGLVAADDIWPEQSYYSRSDHFNFARKGVPILFFFNGIHPQYHRPDDEVGLIDTSKLSRVAQLAFYLGVELANTPTPPQWNPASYQTIVVQQQIPKPAATGH